MKIILVSLLSLSFYSATAFSDDSVKYIKIDIYGKYMAPNAEDEKKVRQTISGFINELKVKEYRLIATGIEGGFSVCVLPRSQSANGSIWMTIDTLSIDSSETTFNAKSVDICE